MSLTCASAVLRDPESSSPLATSSSRSTWSIRPSLQGRQQPPPTRCPAPDVAHTNRQQRLRATPSLCFNLLSSGMQKRCRGPKAAGSRQQQSRPTKQVQVHPRQHVAPSPGQPLQTPVTTELLDFTLAAPVQAPSTVTAAAGTLESSGCWARCKPVRAALLLLQ